MPGKRTQPINHSPRRLVSPKPGEGGSFRAKAGQPLVPRLLSWFAAHARDLPWRRTRDPYAIWVSEIMLQQTQVKTVLPYWERWMTALPTIESLAEASSQTIHKLWEGLGYYTRVRNMQKAAQQIVAHHAGQFPDDFDVILDLPGIGRYTAGAIASIAFNQPRPILDGNVIRVLTRVFGIAGNPRDKTVNTHLWQLAQALVDRAASLSPDSLSLISTPATSAFAAPTLRSLVNRLPRQSEAAAGKSKIVNFGACSALNQSLMELGALVCTPRQPKCPQCPLRTQCVARRTDRIESLPNLGARQTATQRHFAAFIIERRGRFLARQRPAGVVNAHLWEFPNAEAATAHFDPQQIAQTELGFVLGPLEKLSTIKHSITRYRLTLTVFRATLPLASAPRSLSGRWLTLPQLRRLPFTAAHARARDQHLP